MLYAKLFKLLLMMKQQGLLITMNAFRKNKSSFRFCQSLIFDREPSIPIVQENKKSLNQSVKTKTLVILLEDHF